MLTLGINQNYAPVLDVNVNPANPVIGIRSFGEDPSHVARLGQHYIRGLQSAGVLATAKHFPGHGDTHQDSHKTLPTVDHPRARLESVELVPFRAAVAAELASIMTAHVVFSALDTEALPATLSARVLTDVIRDELNFTGMVVTDSMEMQAIAQGYGTVRGAEMAIHAGADQVLVSHNADHQSETYQALARGLAEGRLPSRRIREALDHVRQSKARFSFKTPGLSEPERLEAQGIAETLWQRAVSGVGAVEKLPITDSVVLITFGDTHETTEAEDRIRTAEHPLARAFGDQLVRHITLPRDPDAGQVAEVHRQSKGHVLVVGLDRALLHPAQLTVLDRTWTDGPQIALALSSPYDLRRLPVGSIGLTGFDPSPEAMNALVAVIRGTAPLVGRWPVTIEPARRS
jgi:beta-N-acetylhexosaminidase